MTRQRWSRPGSSCSRSSDSSRWVLAALAAWPMPCRSARLIGLRQLLPPCRKCLLFIPSSPLLLVTSHRIPPQADRHYRLMRWGDDGKRRCAQELALRLKVTLPCRSYGSWSPPGSQRGIVADFTSLCGPPPQNWPIGQETVSHRTLLRTAVMGTPRYPGPHPPARGRGMHRYFSARLARRGIVGGGGA